MPASSRMSTKAKLPVHPDEATLKSIGFREIATASDACEDAEEWGEAMEDCKEENDEGVLDATERAEVPAWQEGSTKMDEGSGAESRRAPAADVMSATLNMEEVIPRSGKEREDVPSPKQRRGEYSSRRNGLFEFPGRSCWQRLAIPGAPRCTRLSLLLGFYSIFAIRR